MQNVEIDGFVGIFDGALEKEYCRDLINYFNDEGDRFVQPVGVDRHINDSDDLYLHERLRDVPPHFIDHFFIVLLQEIYPIYTDKFSALSNLQMQGQGLKMKRIRPGAGFHNWHFESTGDRYPRKVVVQLYLNDIDEAGETEFLYQNKRISPKEGRMLLWPADWTHIHRGNPPIGKEDKYILSTWLEEVVGGYT